MRIGNKPPRRLATVLCVLSGLAAASHARACATCGCSLSTDAAMGYGATSGWRINLEYDYINQDELRSGTHTSNPEAVVNQPSDPALGGGEIEHSTLNRYFTLGVGYSINHDWSVDLRLPYVDRNHSTYGQQQQPYTPAESAPDQISTAQVSSLGDARLIVTYQGLLPTHDLGLQLGLKLPTGEYGTKVNFDSGPQIATPLDASLQAGTGSTDLIVGAYYYRAVSQNFDAFVNGQFQAAVAHRLDQPTNDYRPGNSETVSFGLRYEAHPAFVPQAQVNIVHRSSDQGALADTTDTSGLVAYLSPGLTARLGRGFYGYGFIQVPVYSNLGGYQLFPHWTATVGVHRAF